MNLTKMGKFLLLVFKNDQSSKKFVPISYEIIKIKDFKQAMIYFSYSQV